MLKSTFNEILLDQRESFFEKKDLIERNINLEKYIKTRQIVVISGVRRCGKSSLLYIIKEKIAKKINQKNMLYVNFDDERLVDIQPENFNEIYLWFLEKFNPEKGKICFFFDEIQNTKGWEKFLSRMYDTGIKIFVTGSNATLLSSEIATALTGRNLVLELYPFSFKESLLLSGITDLDYTTLKKAGLKAHFNDYVRFGGFPLVLKEKQRDILADYYRDVFYRDIISRHSVTKIKEIKLIGNFLSANIGKQISYNTLKNISGVNSLSTIKNYLDYFRSSFLFFTIEMFSYSLKKQILSSKKVYGVDTGLVLEVGFSFSGNSGRLLENIVFLELKRRGFEIYYYSEKYECDFVLKGKTKIINVVQVTKEITPENEKREYGGLIDAMEAYGLKEGIILTEDTDDSVSLDEKTIIIKPVWKWLLE